MVGSRTRGREWAWTLVAMILLITLKGATGRKPVLHRVGGGRYTWAPNINFTQWASHEVFYVGDWLWHHTVALARKNPQELVIGSAYKLSLDVNLNRADFGFDKYQYNVLQVNKTSYDTCADKDFIANITRGGRDVFNLTKAMPYYFLSGGGYCLKGMKLAISVKEAPLNDPTRPPPHILPKSNGSTRITKANTPVLSITTFMSLIFLFMH